MVWWLWVVVGLGLLAFEMAMPGGFFALFFGVGALLVGGLVLPLLSRTPLGSMAGAWQYAPFIGWTIWDTVASFGAPERWALRMGL